MKEQTGNGEDRCDEILTEEIDKRPAKAVLHTNSKLIIL